MSRLSPSRALALWLEQSSMTEAEKADCLRQAEKGFAQAADLLLLGQRGREEWEILRALGIGSIRQGRFGRLQNWRISPCPVKRNQRDCMERFLKTGAGRKKLVILLSSAGRGTRIRMKRLWKKAGLALVESPQKPAVLAVQVKLYRRRGGGDKILLDYVRQEKKEAQLQQAAEDCLLQQTTVLTLRVRGRRIWEKEQLWYHLAKRI